MNQKMLVISAHVGDFVWRSGGTLAKYAEAGAEIKLIVLSYGMRGEANAYWKKEGADLEEGKAIRHAEGAKAVEILGISDMEVLDFEDYPLELDFARMELLAKKIREFAPDTILTHDRERDIYNGDHTLIGEKVYHICAIASAKGAALEGTSPVPRPAVYGFEPHVSEICHFQPRLYVDITGVMEKKKKAMEAYSTQKEMYAAYLNRGRLRGMQTGVPHLLSFPACEPVLVFVFPLKLLSAGDHGRNWRNLGLRGAGKEGGGVNVKLLLELFLSFAKIGFTSFGGLSMVPVITSEMTSHGWMTEEQISKSAGHCRNDAGAIRVKLLYFCRNAGGRCSRRVSGKHGRHASKPYPLPVGGGIF